MKSFSPQKTTFFDKKFDADNPPIVVVGAGISGSIAALGATAKGYPVVLITKYQTPTRTQEVFLNSAEIKSLESKFKDNNDNKDREFFRKLNNNTVSIKSIERFLHRKLKQAREEGLIDYLDASQGKLTDISTEHLQVTITDPQGKTATISFRHIVDASGTSRTAFKLAKRKERGADIDQLVEEHIEFQPPHKSYGTATFHLKEHVSSNIELRNTPLITKVWNIIKSPIASQTIHRPTFSQNEIEALQKAFGWDHNYQPTVYIITDEKRKKFYVGGEIPESILKDLDQVEKWSRYILLHHFVIEEDKLIIRDHNEDKRVTSFPIRLRRLIDPVQELSKNPLDSCVLAGIGDCVQDPYFLQSHGANDAIKGAIAFLECLPENNSDQLFNKDKFKLFINELYREHHLRMKDENKVYQHKRNKHGVPSKAKTTNIPTTTNTILSRFKSEEVMIKTSPALTRQDTAIQEELDALPDDIDELMRELYELDSLDDWELVENKDVTWAGNQPTLKEHTHESDANLTKSVFFK
jgi:hypothetical protein